VADGRLGRLSAGLPRHDLKRKEPHIYVANWFYLAFIVTIAMLHIVNNLAMPVSLLGSKSYSLLRRAGCADAVVVRPQRGRLLPDRRLPGDDVLLRAEAGRAAGLFSYRLSIIHFWSLIFLYIWAGPHHLHYTALPDWAQTLGMVFSIMLWMPSWGGMINGLMTLSGAWDKLRTDPIIRMMVWPRLLRHVDLRRPDDVDQGGQQRCRTTPTGPSATCIPARWAGTA
jgi:cytochrome c oxidase cbb3-type subunit 1